VVCDNSLEKGAKACEGCFCGWEGGAFLGVDWFEISDSFFLFPGFDGIFGPAEFSGIYADVEDSVFLCRDKEAVAVFVAHVRLCCQPGLSISLHRRFCRRFIQRVFLCFRHKKFKPFRDSTLPPSPKTRVGVVPNSPATANVRSTAFSTLLTANPV